MIKQSELISLSKGDHIDHFLLVKKSEVRLTKAGKEFLSLELGDKSASAAANVWMIIQHLNLSVILCLLVILLK